MAHSVLTADYRLQN